MSVAARHYAPDLNLLPSLGTPVLHLLWAKTFRCPIKLYCSQGAVYTLYLADTHQQYLEGSYIYICWPDDAGCYVDRAVPAIARIGLY